MPDKNEYEARVATLLKSELKKADCTYKELAKRLGDMGIEENALNIGNKLSRGKFSAVFMVQCLEAIGVKKLRIKRPKTD